MSPTHPKKGPANIPVKTAIHVSYAVMIAATYALAKNPATVKNMPKECNHESSKLLFWENLWYCCGPVFTFHRFSPHAYKFYNNSRHWVVYRHSGSRPGRCFFRRQKKQGMCVDRATNERYFSVLSREIIRIWHSELKSMVKQLPAKESWPAVVFALDGKQQIVYRIFTINFNLERLKWMKNFHKIPDAVRNRMGNRRG